MKSLNKHVNSSCSTLYKKAESKANYAVVMYKKFIANIKGSRLNKSLDSAAQMMLKESVTSFYNKRVYGVKEIGENRLNKRKSLDRTMMKIINLKKDIEGFGNDINKLRKQQKSTNKLKFSSNPRYIKVGKLFDDCPLETRTDYKKYKSFCRIKAGNQKLARDKVINKELNDSKVQKISKPRSQQSLFYKTILNKDTSDNEIERMKSLLICEKSKIIIDKNKIENIRYHLPKLQIFNHH